MGLQCPTCQLESPAGARFCMNCAAPLARACASCGGGLPQGAHFCPQCAHPAETIPSAQSAPPPREPRSYTPKHLADKILQSKSALEGERKQVTVLFADVKGSMELAERVDPEEWHRILDHFFQILTEGVHRFEGTVNQYTGDGIMALFGAPISHEDHAQRACYAALHLRDALKAYSDELRLSRSLDFAVRVGINSGAVVVGRIGDDLRMDYTAAGHTVGLAQRMEQMAAAHSICVSEATARLASGYLEFRDLGTAALKGVSSRIHVFELVGAGQHLTRLDVARSRGLTRFVGRDSDMQTLEAALEQARAGDGQVVGLVAEAGTGKSRLCLEFVERCRERGISANEGHCPAHGKAVPYLPVLEMLRDIFEIGDRDSDHDARRKIAGELLLLDSGLQEFLPLVFDFLGVPDPERPAPELSPEARQRQLVAFLRRLIGARSRRELRVLLIDDAHWIDPGSDALIAQGVEAASGTRTLWLINFRPEYNADWMGRSYYRRMPLLPLGRDATDELVAELLGRDPSLAGLSRKIQERTHGNPFFVEEVAALLVEIGCLEGSRGAYRLVRPVEAVEIPDAVRVVLAARIDRLPEREKQLLQAASVIGKELPEPILRRVAGLPDAELSAALASLVQGEFLFERAVYPEAEYVFKHPLTQEVALASQLADRRAEMHAAVARTIEEVDADRLDEQAALLAHHWEHAGDAAMGAHWHARAARWSALDNAVEALRHWSRVRTLLRGAPESEKTTTALLLEAAIETLHFGLRLGMGDEEAQAILAEGRQLADRSGDLGSQVLLLHGYASIVGIGIGDPEEMRDAVEEATELAEKTGDPKLRFSVCEGMIDFLHFTGRLTEAARGCDTTIEFGYDHLGPGTIVRGVPVAWTFGRRAWIETLMGRLDEAAHSLRKCEEGTRGLEHAEVQSWTECVWVVHRLWVGDAAGALSHARRALDAAEKFGANLSRIWAYHHLGVALALSGDCEAAVEQLELALRTARETRSWLTIEAEVLAHLAEALLGAGQSERAQRTATEAIETGRRRRTPVGEAQGQLALARVLLSRFGAKSRKEIDSALENCLSLVAQMQAHVYEPHVHEARSQLAGLVGDPATQERELREAHRLLTEMGATGHAERVGRERGL